MSIFLTLLNQVKRKRGYYAGFNNFVADYWANYGLTYDGSNRVATWVDRFTKTNSATQSTDAKKPLYIANFWGTGLHSVRGDGVDDVMPFTSPSGLTGVKNWTLWIVMQLNSLTGIRVPVTIGTTGAGYEINANKIGTGKRGITAKGVGDMNDGAATLNPEIWCVKCDNSNIVSLKVNGIAQSLDANSIVTSVPSGGFLFAKSTVSFAAVDIGRFLLSNALYSDSDESRVTARLNADYGHLFF